MSTKLEQFKVDRHLLNSKFEGYKLSLDLFPIHTAELSKNVYQCQASDSQWSLMHVHLLANHNHLVYDHWNTTTLSFYTVFTDGEILQLVHNEDNKKLSLHNVFNVQFPQDHSNRGDKYNASISFPSSSFALVSNGCGLLNVCDRSALPWKVVYANSDVCDGSAFAIVDSKYDQNSKCLECLLKFVGEIRDVDNKHSHYVTSLTWIYLTHSADNGWTLTRTRNLHTKGIVEYAEFSRTNSLLCVIGTKRVHFVKDSEKPVQQTEDGKTNGSSLSKEYKWTQTTDEVFVDFIIDQSITESDIDFSITSDSVKFSLKTDQCVLLKGNFYLPIDINGSRWTLNDGKLRLTLSKVDLGRMWTEVILGDVRGDYFCDPAVTNLATEKMEGLTTETLDKENVEIVAEQPIDQQLEECDETFDAEFSLYWLDGDTHAVVSESDLSSHQWLFAVRLDADEQSSVCLRYDVDGLLWRAPNRPVSGDGSGEENVPPFRHYASFNAFGYVHAGKESRKFSTCSSDCSYAVIADCNKHAYVYWRHRPLETSLRNRKTGRDVSGHVSKQQLISLTDNSEDILGLVALPRIMLLLTNSKCYVIQVDDQKSIE